MKCKFWWVKGKGSKKGGERPAESTKAEGWLSTQNQGPHQTKEGGEGYCDNGHHKRRGAFQNTLKKEKRERTVKTEKSQRRVDAKPGQPRVLKTGGRQQWRGEGGGKMGQGLIAETGWPK